MILYVETNFVMELALRQPEHQACRDLLSLVKQRSDIELALPAFCIGEAYEAGERKWTQRRKLHQNLLTEIGQIQRSEPYRKRSKELRELTGLLVESGEEQKRVLDGLLKELLGVARVLPLNRETFARAVEFQTTRDLKPQDSIVYASVIADLEAHSGETSCFVTRDRNDFFSNQDIQDELDRLACKLLGKFTDAFGYVQSRSS